MYKLVRADGTLVGDGTDGYFPAERRYCKNMLLAYMSNKPARVTGVGIIVKGVITFKRCS